MERRGVEVVTPPPHGAQATELRLNAYEIAKSIEVKRKARVLMSTVNDTTVLFPYSYGLVNILHDIIQKQLG